MLIMKAVYGKSLWQIFFLAINDSMNDLKINYNNKDLMYDGSS